MKGAEMLFWPVLDLLLQFSGLSFPAHRGTSMGIGVWQHLAGCWLEASPARWVHMDIKPINNTYMSCHLPPW